MEAVKVMSKTWMEIDIKDEEARYIKLKKELEDKIKSRTIPEQLKKESSGYVRQSLHKGYKLKISLLHKTDFI